MNIRRNLSGIKIDVRVWNAHWSMSLSVFPAHGMRIVPVCQNHVGGYGTRTRDYIRLYYNTTIRLYYYTTIPLYHYTTILLYHYTTI